MNSTKNYTDTAVDMDFAKAVEKGLSASPKSVPSRYFYDDRGSELFKAIMALPEYYLTDSEYEIFSTQKDTILDTILAGAESFELIEFGAGDGLKTKVLLRYFLERGADFKFLPIDISEDALKGLVDDCAAEMPDLQVEALHGEYFKSLEVLKARSDKRKVVLFLGSNIGNFDTDGAINFLSEMRKDLSPGDLVITGFDLKKDPDLIIAAYDDRQGVTEAFNLNLLERINRELGANFDASLFKHYTFYNPENGEVRSYLISLKKQDVCIGSLGKTFHFDYAEPIHTEISRKYNLDDISMLAEKSGFSIKSNLLDCKHYFADSIWVAK